MQLGTIETILEEIVAFSNQVNDGATVGAQANDNSVSDDSKGTIDGVCDGASDGALKILDEQVHTKVAAILNGLGQWTKRSDLFAQIGLTNHSTNRKKYLDPLFDFGWIQMEFPDNPTHPNQRYKITKSGTRILELITG